jgi:hypothetical protein
MRSISPVSLIKVGPPAYICFRSMRSISITRESSLVPPTARFEFGSLITGSPAERAIVRRKKKNGNALRPNQGARSENADCVHARSLCYSTLLLCGTYNNTVHIQIIRSSLSFLIRSGEYDRSSESTSSVCWPSSGGGSLMLGRVSLYLTGMPVTLIFPACAN